MSRRISDGQGTCWSQRTWRLAGLVAACLVAQGALGWAAGEKAARREPDDLPADALARLGTTHLRHQAEVTFVSFSADDKSLFTAGRDNTIRQWDLASGKEMRRFAIPKATPKAPNIKNGEIEVMEMMAGARNSGGFRVDVTPDGKTLAVGVSNVVHLYDTATDKGPRQIEGAPAGLTGLLFSANGGTLAARTTNGAIYLWSAESGKLLHQIKPPPRKAGNALVFTLGGGDSDPAGMAFSPDGKILAAASLEPEKEPERGAIKLWDVATGKTLRHIKSSKNARASAVAISADGKTLAYASGAVIHLCQAEDGKEVRNFKADGGVRTIVFSPDGSKLVTRTSDQRTRLWETATGEELHELAEAAPSRRANAGGFLVFAGAQAGPESRAVAFSRDGTRIVAAAGNTIRVWEADTGKEVHLRDGHRVAPSRIVHVAGGKVVVSWGADRVIRRWDSASGRSLGTFPAPKSTTLAAFSPDGRMAALANTDKSIRLLDTSTGKQVRRFDEKTSASALSFSPDGKTLAARGSDNVIRFYELQRGVEVRQIQMRPRNNQGQPNVLVIGGARQGANGPGPGLAFSPDGRLIVAPAPGAAATLLLFDLATGKEVRTIDAPLGIVSFAFSPDSRSLATENADWTITLWEVASGKQQARMGKPVVASQPAGGGMGGFAFVVDGFPGGDAGAPTGPVHLSFSADGRAIAMRGSGEAVDVHDVATGEQVGQFKGHKGRIETLAFAPDSRMLATGATDTTILLWDAARAMKSLSKPQAVQFAPDDLKSHWENLAGADAARARSSLRALAADPAQVVPFLGRQFKPVVPLDPQRLDGWIADLSNEKFLVRKQASERLLDAGGQAVPALQKALKAKHSLETRRRLEGLVNQLTRGTLTVEQLRLFRALETLERMNTDEARRLLRDLAQGAPAAFATREAQAVLDRLAQIGR